MWLSIWCGCLHPNSAFTAKAVWADFRQRRKFPFLIPGDFLFKLGVFVVLSGASLTGWGCSCPCGAAADYGTAVGPCAASLVPDGACYTRVAYVPMTCCWHSFGSAFPSMFSSLLFPNSWRTTLCLSHLLSVHLTIVIASLTLLLHGCKMLSKYISKASNMILIQIRVTSCHMI